MGQPVTSTAPPDGYGIPCPSGIASIISNIFTLPQYKYNNLYEQEQKYTFTNVQVGNLYYFNPSGPPYTWYDISDTQLVIAKTHKDPIINASIVYDEVISARIGVPSSNIKPSTITTIIKEAFYPGFLAYGDKSYIGCGAFNLSDDRETRIYHDNTVIPAVKISYDATLEDSSTVHVEGYISMTNLLLMSSANSYTKVQYHEQFNTIVGYSKANSLLMQVGVISTGAKEARSVAPVSFYISNQGINSVFNVVDIPSGYYSAFPNLIIAPSPTDFKFMPQLSDRQLQNLRDETANELGTETSPTDPDANPNFGDLPDGSTEVNDSATGLYSRYLVSPGTLVTLSDWLWTTGSEIFEAFTNFLYGKPIDTVISLVSYPFNVGSLLGSAASTVKFGNNNTGVAANLLTENSAQINWGTISLASINRNQNFLDMAPYTQLKLYLPWGTGFVDIDPSDVIDIDKTNGVFLGGTLGVISNFEVAKGTVVHNVVNGNGVVIGSYSTNVGRQIAVVGNDYAAKQIQVIAGVVGLAALTAVAGTAGMTAGMSAAFTPQTFAAGTSAVQSSISAGLREGIRTAGSVVSSRAGRRVAMASTAAIATAPMNVYRSGTFTEGSAGMGIQYPYLLVSQPKADIPQNYGSYYGYPCNKFVTLGSLSGYTEVGSVHLDGIPATESEMNELERIIQGGIIL